MRWTGCSQSIMKPQQRVREGWKPYHTILPREKVPHHGAGGHNRWDIFFRFLLRTTFIHTHTHSFSAFSKNTSKSADYFSPQPLSCSASGILWEKLWTPTFWSLWLEPSRKTKPSLPLRGSLVFMFADGNVGLAEGWFTKKIGLIEIDNPLLLICNYYNDHTNKWKAIRWSASLQNC